MDINMNDKNFLEKLKLVLDNDEIFENEMMNKHTTFQLGGPAKFFIKPKSINKITKVILLCKEYSIEYFILGNGSNLLVSDHGYDGLIINIHEENFSDLNVEEIDETHNKVIVGGGMLMRTLAKKMCLLSLSGLEDIIDIPGTIGGGIIMNASAGGKGLIYNSLKKVKVITPEGEIKELSKEECNLRHRGSLLKDKKLMVIEATFNLIKDDKIKIQKAMADHTSLRYSRQPMYFPSAGCFFIWVKPKHGSLYEKYKENNLVSYKVGDAMIYTHNIAFIVNLGKAKSSDVYEIVIHVEKIMKSKYNLDIKREVVVLGSFQ
jgi:UDP-N-acetylmuramate dehydrogenase